jgi:NAD(P)-dependent dehydrogenase (short-subunit alcohol dehydrogenase family)
VPRVFITGSADGLGKMAAELLIAEGHQVVLHGRNEERAKDALEAVPKAEATVMGDLASLAQTKAVAEQVNKLGAFDAVIHNAGVGYREPKRVETEDGLPHVFAINTLAPYILTALIAKPKRLVYLSSGMHHGGRVAERGRIRTSDTFTSPNYEVCHRVIVFRPVCAPKCAALDRSATSP